MSEVADALDLYVQALLDGEAADVDAWLAEHPELDAALRDELEMVASLHRAAGSVVADAESAESGASDGASASGTRLIERGTRLGECVVEELIGAGGMGEVYRAHHEVMGRDVALKVLRPFLADQPDAVARFRKEVKAQASLGPHANVVTAMHASEHEGRLYLVMEHVPGTNLSRLVRAEGPVEPQRAAKMIGEAARGLAHAHAAGIVHRDIKPSNLLLTEDGQVKVVDLGLARLAMSTDDSEARPTWVDELVGSLDYMAPEQANRPDDADERSDLYALGCTLYFLLEGRAPFADRLALKKLMAHAVDAPPSLTRAVPEGLRAVLSRLLEKDPALRYPSADALLTALEALGSEAAGSETLSMSGSGAGLPSSSVDRGSSNLRGAPQTSRAASRNRWLLGGAALVFLLSSVALLGILLTRKPPVQLGVGSPVSGTLEAGDGLRPKEHAFFDAHPLNVVEGQTYVFTMRSLAFDPMLLLRAESWEVGQNDDAPGGGLGAQMVWTAVSTGPIEVVATTPVEGAGGSYVLSVEPLDLPALTLESTVRGTLETSDERFVEDDTLLDRYWLATEAGETYVFTMQGQGFLPFLFLATDDQRMIAGSRPTPGETNSVTLVYIAERAGAVFVGANTQLPGGSGAYELTVASELAGEEVLHEGGILSEGDPTLGDESYYDEHPLPVRAGHTYVITMRSDDFDAYLLLVDSDGTRVAQNDDAIGTDSRLVYRAREDAQMRVQANSYTSGMQGQYTLIARELRESAEP